MIKAVRIEKRNNGIDGREDKVRRRSQFSFTMS